LTSARLVPGPSGRNKIGTPSPQAWAIPPKEFSTPGPPCEAKTPHVLPFSIRLKPSAAMMPPRSWRKTIGRMPSFATASISGLEGKHAIHSTPSMRRILAMAS
jgi:hypothetical protein